MTNTAQLKIQNSNVDEMQLNIKTCKISKQIFEDEVTFFLSYRQIERNY